MMDLGMLIVTLVLAVAYQLWGKGYAMQNFDLTFTLIYRAVILPLFLFYLGRVIAKFISAKRPLAIFSPKSCRLLCVLVWVLHFGLILGVRYLQWSYQAALGITCPWIFLLAGLCGLLCKKEAM